HLHGLIPPTREGTVAWENRFSFQESCRIKQFRRVATRYDKLSERFASFVALTAAFIWLF
ncbi:IS5/IS1182 family transposase, partial [Sodalis-like symbiont of Philaenus spumarius]